MLLIRREVPWLEDRSDLFGGSLMCGVTASCMVHGAREFSPERVGIEWKRQLSIQATVMNSNNAVLYFQCWSFNPVVTRVLLKSASGSSPETSESKTTAKYKRKNFLHLAL